MERPPQPPNVSSFSRWSAERSKIRRNDYENTRDIIRSPVVKDPRRKPYYYNELNQNVAEDHGKDDLPPIDLNGAVDDLQNTTQTANDGEEDEVVRNTLFNSNTNVTFGSGGSLENII